MPVSRSWKTRSLWAMGTVVAAAGGVALAAVPGPRRVPVNQAVTVSGSLTYAWHGDPSRGCGARGVCGIHGSLIVSFDGYGNLFLSGRQGTADLVGASATARARRDDPGLQPGECVDLLSVDSLGIQLNRTRGGRYLATLNDAPVSGGRCAGPIAKELARLRLPATRLKTRALGFDLHGRAAFGAGPFSGELVSTVVLRPDNADQQSQSSSSSGTSQSSSGPPRRPHRILIEYAKLRYRIVGAAGALQANFTGDGMPYCVPLDDCGVAGELRVSVHGYHDTWVVVASRIVRHRVGRRQALTDLRAGKLNLGPETRLISQAGASVSEMMTRAGTTACHDAGGGPLFLQVNPFGRFAAGMLPVSLVSPGGADSLRTNCPGPSTGDVTGIPSANGFPFPSDRPLAQGTIAIKALGSQQFELSLPFQGRFSGAGYSGTRAGGLQFSLSLAAANGGTRSERVFG